MFTIEQKRASNRRSYHKHREKWLTYWKTKGQDPEFRAKKVEAASAWYAANKAKKQAYDKQYAAKNRQRRRETGLAYYHRHPEKYREWVRNHPENTRRYARKWAKKSGYAAAKRRRARIAGLSIDKTADAFYRFVRSRKSIPCYYCGRSVSGKKAHIDHVIAVSKQGNHASDNLCASCPSCNQKKSARLPSEITFLPQPLLNL